MNGTRAAQTNFPVAPLKQQKLLVTSIIAGGGVAGIPEAGLIGLPLALSATGLPDHVIVTAIPLVMTVAWIIARARSGVNAMSILLDAGAVFPGHQTERDSIPVRSHSSH